MLRKGFFVLAVVFSVLSIAIALLSSMSGNSSSKPDFSDADDSLQGRLMWLCNQYNGEITDPGALVELIKQAGDVTVPVGEQTITYGLKRIFEFYDTNPGIPLCLSRNAINRNFFALVKHFPVEFLRCVDDDSIYVVYKTTDDDGLIHFAYIFFQAEKRENGEVWLQQNPILIANKPLQYNDFASITQGVSASEVQKIDPVTKFYIDGIIKPNVGSARESIHLTKDGIITISYILQNDDFIVESISKTPDYHFVSGDVISINQQDLPENAMTMKY